MLSSIIQPKCRQRGCRLGSVSTEKLKPGDGYDSPSSAANFITNRWVLMRFDSAACPVLEIIATSCPTPLRLRAFTAGSAGFLLLIQSRDARRSRLRLG